MGLGLAIDNGGGGGGGGGGRGYRARGSVLLSPRRQWRQWLHEKNAWEEADIIQLSGVLTLAEGP
jgi:hypothetical protein